ncbi:hypothetical protein [Streptomyces sp. Qhu_M48]|uniref:hypothetical protein n=1 Tax=Streptomyces sp. Qhu_M48 TaxID=3435889 RepID=UPI003F4FDF62
MSVKVAVIYHSATGAVHQLARALAEGAGKTGAEVRLRRVPELARGSVIVSPGFTDPAVYAAGGNPYGTAHPGAYGAPGENVLAAARYQGERLTGIAKRLKGRAVD